MILAVIDIGSNVVRSVVYSDNSIQAYEIYHERFKIDLDGLFCEDNVSAKHPFYAIINRFIDIFNKLKVDEIKCVATAILRDNPNAEQFCKMFYDKYKINIEILSGQQEAFLSSCGLLMGSPNPHGIIADLGGGSLELAEVHAHKINKLTSLPLGTQVLQDIENLNLEYIISRIKTLYDKPHKSNLYLIGGGFRVIGKAYISHAKYPLYNIHNLEIEQQDLNKYLEYLHNNSNSVFSTARSNDKFAIIVLQGLIQVFNPEKVLISNYGLKEGVRYTRLPQNDRYKDVIFERCKTFINYTEGSIDLDGYIALMQQFLKTPEDDLDDVNDIIRISLIFLHFKKGIDRNFYGHFLSHAILMSDIPFTHKQRAMISLIMSCAFGNKSNNYVQQLADKILSHNDHKIAKVIAKMLNIALILDGPELVEQISFSIEYESNKPNIKTSQTLPYNLFHHVSKILKSINRIVTR